MTTMADSSHKRPPVAVIIIVALVLIGGGVWWWWSSQNTAAADDATLSGSVEATQYQVTPALAGRVTEVPVAEGDTVSEGDTVVQLDTTLLALQVDQAKEGVTAAKAAVENAKDDGTDADVKAANAKVKQAEAAQKLAETQVSYATVTAPHDGVVTSVTTNVGQNASPARTVLTLTDPNSLFARVYVSETQIGNVKAGQSVTVTTDSSTDTFDGKVTFVATEAQFTPNTIQTKDQRVKLVYEVRVSLTDDSGTLKPGMPVDVVLS